MDTIIMPELCLYKYNQIHTMYFLLTDLICHDVNFFGLGNFLPDLNWTRRGEPHLTSHPVALTTLTLWIYYEPLQSKWSLIYRISKTKTTNCFHIYYGTLPDPRKVYILPTSFPLQTSIIQNVSFTVLTPWASPTTAGSRPPALGQRTLRKSWRDWIEFQFWRFLEGWLVRRSFKYGCGNVVMNIWSPGEWLEQ